MCVSVIYIYTWTVHHGRLHRETTKKVKKRKEKKETLRRRRQAPNPPSTPKNRGQATPTQMCEFEQGSCTA